MKFPSRVVAAILVLGTSTSARADGEPVAPRAVNLPAGPGSLEGFGQAHDVSPATGLPSLTVPLELPRGRGGLSVPLALRYRPGVGAGPVGLDWTLDLPRLERSTRAGVPAYTADDPLVLRGIGGGEELVTTAPGVLRTRIESAATVEVRPRGGDYEAVTLDGTVYRFGAHANAFGNPFAWELASIRDVHGNRVEFDWNTAEGAPRLDAIRYNDGGAAIRFEYERRPDSVVRSVSGQRVELRYRIAQIVTYVDGEAVRVHDLRYEQSAGVPSSTLVEVQTRGADGTALVPWIFSYSGIQPERSHVEVANGPALDPTTGGRALVDVDGDALPDLLDGGPGGWRLRRNLGGEAFGPWTDLASRPAADLADPFRLSDVDADGIADIVVRRAAGGDGLRAFLGGGEDPYGRAIDVGLPVGFDLTDPAVVVTDLTLDGRADVLRVEDGECWLWRADTAGGFGPAERRPGPPAELVPGRAGVVVVDMDGDRLPELVRLDPDRRGLFVATATGVATWAAPVRLEHAPGMEDLDRWHLRDMNGDGAADLVRTGRTSLTVWVNGLDGRFQDAVGMPWPDLEDHEVVTFADMDASGTLDVLRVDPRSGIWRYWAPMPLRPGLLTRFRNGLGRVVDLVYRPAAQVAHEDEQAGEPWAHRLPIAVPVLASTLEWDHTGFSRVVDHRVRDGYFDPARAEFRGFATLEDRRLGDAYARDRVERKTFDLGFDDEARKGALLRTEVADETGTLRRTEHHYAIETSGPVQLLRRVATDVWHEEGADPRATARVRTEFGWDRWGNPVRVHELGRVDPDTGVDIPGDERLTERRYAQGDDDAPRDRLSEETVRSGDGDRISARRVYYDGPPGRGLELGRVERGLAHREAVWVQDEQWIDAARRTFDGFGNVVRERDPEGGRMQWEYEAGLFPSRETRWADPEGAGLSYRFTWSRSIGTLNGVEDPSGARTSFLHDGLGRLLAVVEPGDDGEHPTAAYAYHLDAAVPRIEIRRRRISGEDDVDLEVQYLDGAGRIYQRLTADDAGNGAVLAEAVVRGADGQPGRVLVPTWADASHLAGDGPVELVEAEGPATLTRRDGLGRVVETVFPDGRTSRVRHLPLRSIHLDHEDLAHQAPYVETPRVIEQDGLGRTVRIVDRLPSGEAVHDYRYDPGDRVTRYTDPGGWETDYTYDGRGLLVRVDSPDAGLVEQGYDDAGRLIHRIDARGAIVIWERDGIGRPVLEAGFGPDGRAQTLVERTYDACAPALADPERCAGRLAGVEDDAGRLELGYDVRGRADRWRRHVAPGGEPRVLTYRVELDAQGRVTREHFPVGDPVRRTYGARGLLRSVEGFVDDVRYDPAGLWTQMALANGVTQRREHDPMGRVRAHSVGGNGGDLWSVTYDYDVAGLLARVQDHVGATSHSPALDQVFEHDDLHRLVRASGDYGVLTWAYDTQGNLLEHDGRPIGYGVGHPHAAVAIGDQTLDYDAAGRLERITGTGPLVPGSWSFDAHGRLREVQLAEDRRVESVYGHDGARAIRREWAGGELVSETWVVTPQLEVRDGELVRWLHVAGERLVEWRDELPPADDEDPLPLFGGFVGLGGRPRRRVARRHRAGVVGSATVVVLVVAFGPSCGTTTWSGRAAPIRVRYHVVDRLGTSALSVDGTGDIVADARVPGTPHGRPRSAPDLTNGPRSIDHRVAGHRWDPRTGAVHAGARIYLPGLGRFASPDPVRLEPSWPRIRWADDHDPYGYAAGNPVDRVDPDGRASEHVGVRWEVSLGTVRMSATVSWVRDDGGGQGLALSVGAGRGLGVEAGVSAVFGRTTARTVDALQGVSQRQGASVANGIRVGVDAVAGSDYQGLEISAGAGEGAETHETTVVTRVLRPADLRATWRGLKRLVPGGPP